MATTFPEFLDYSPEDVLAMGREQGLPPEEIAAGLMRHRSNVEGWGREQAPETYWKGALQLDKDTEAALGKVRRTAEQEALAQALPEEQDRLNLAYQLEASGYDPEAVDPELRPALEAVQQVRQRPEWQMPQRIYGGEVAVGNVPLARYALREAGDGQMDVSLQLPDDSEALTRVPKATAEDVQAEIQREQARLQELDGQMEAARVGESGPDVMGFGTPPLMTGRIERQRAEALRRIENLQAGGPIYLMGERVREELKKPEWRGRVGDVNGWEEFAKGLADATLTTGAVVARVAGADDWMQELSGAQEALDEALPGSTRRRLEGGTWNESVGGAQRAVGMMLPSLAGGGVTRLATAAAARGGSTAAGAELARQAGGRLGVAGAGMSASASGGAYLQTQRMIEEAEAAGDMERADRLRLGRDLHAILTGAAEGVVERMGAAQAFNLGTRGGARGLTRQLLGEAAEEPITGVLQRGAVDPGTIAETPDVLGPVGTETLTGLMAAVPIVGGGAVVQRLAGQGQPRQPGPQVQTVESGEAMIPDNMRAPTNPAAGMLVAEITPLPGVARRAGQLAPVVPQDLESGPADAGTVEGDVTQGMQRRPAGAEKVAGETVTPTNSPAFEAIASEATLTDEIPGSIIQVVEEDVRTPVTIFRAGAAEEVGVKPFSSWSEEKATAQSYQDNPGFGGDILRELRVDAGNVLQANTTTRSGMRDFADAIGFDREVGDEWFDNGWRYPWEESPKIRRALEESEFDSVRYVDDFPAGATTIIFTREPKLIKDAPGVPSGDPPTSQGFRNTAPRGRNSQAGFVAADVLNALPDLAAAAIRAGQDFAAWAADMVRRFGEAVRQYLQGAWQAARKTSQVGAINLAPVPISARQATQNSDSLLSQIRARFTQEQLDSFVMPPEWRPGAASFRSEAMEYRADTEDRIQESIERNLRLVNAVSALEEQLRQHNAARGSYSKEQWQQVKKAWRIDEERLKRWIKEAEAEAKIARALVSNLERLLEYRRVFGRGFMSSVGTGSWYFHVPGQPVVRISDHNKNRAGVQLDVLPSVAETLGLKQQALTASGEGSRPVGQTEQAPRVDQNLPDDDLSAGDVNQNSRGFSNTQPVGFRADGSTVIFGELVDLAAAAVRAGVDFARWSAQMLREFGQLIQQYLAGAWQAATKTSQRGAVLNPWASPRGGTAVFHKQGEAFRVNALGVRQMLTGSPLPGALVPVLDRTQLEKQALENTAAALGRDLETALVSAADRLGRPRADLEQEVNAFLDGAPGAAAMLNGLDPVLFERSRRVRNLVDDLSVQVSRLLPVGPLRQTLVNNLGSWMRRAYDAFDPASGWNYDNVLQAAHAGRVFSGRDARAILRAAARTLNAQAGYVGQMDALGLPREGTALEADLRDLMDRNTWERGLAGPGGVRQNVGSFMRRQSLPAEIRAVMGERTNPVERFAGSVRFQSQYLARHHGQRAMRTVGLASGLFSTARGGVYTEEIPTEGGQWSGLGGLWTTPQLMQALTQAAGVTQEGTEIWGMAGKVLRFLSAKAKMNRVAQNPDSVAVNLLGGVAMMLANGDWYSGAVIRRLNESIRLQRAGRAKAGDQVNAVQEALQDAQRDMAARLTAAGVIGSGLTLADLEASLPRAVNTFLDLNERLDRAAGAVEGAIVGQALGRGLGLPGRAVGAAVGAVAGGVAGGRRIRNWQMRVADWALQKPDMLFRVTGYLTNYESALAAGMTPDAAMNWAAQRTLNTFPNYSAVPAFLRELSRYGVINSFVSFMYEIPRNTAWTIRAMHEELNSGNPALQRRGLQRLAGLSTIGLLMGGGLKAGLAFLAGGEGDVGGDDERNRLFNKWFAAPWERDAVLAFTKYDKDGVSYLNTSYILPQNVLAELATAAANGENPSDSAARVVERLLTQFAGDSVNLTPLLQAWANQKATGAKITYKEGAAGALERMDHALRVIGEPGFADKIERLTYAFREAERRGRTFSVEQELRRVLGLREMTRTWQDLTLNRYRDFSRRNSDIRADANRTLGEGLPGASQRALADANAKLQALREEVATFERDAAKLGVPLNVLRTAKGEANVPRVIADVVLDPTGKRVKSMGR